MRSRTLLIAFVGWLLGSFFGLGNLLGMIRGMRPNAAAAS